MELYAHCVCVYVRACSVVSCSLRSHGLQPTRTPVHGIISEIILEWVSISSSRDLLPLGMEPAFLVAPVLEGKLFTTEPLGKLGSYNKIP